MLTQAWIPSFQPKDGLIIRSPPPQFLADQLTLNPISTGGEGQIMPTIVLCASLRFSSLLTALWPCANSKRSEQMLSTRALSFYEAPIAQKLVQLVRTAEDLLLLAQGCQSV